MQVVPSSKYQNRIRTSRNENLVPHTSVKHTLVCKIEQVYDSEQIDSGNIPEEIKNRILRSPGLVFARVVTVPKNKVLYLPFALTEELLYSVYGNAELLKNRMGKIQFQGLSVESGQIVLQRTYYEKHLNLKEAGNARDIGGII